MTEDDAIMTDDVDDRVVLLIRIITTIINIIVHRPSPSES